MVIFHAIDKFWNISLNTSSLHLCKKDEKGEKGRHSGKRNTIQRLKMHIWRAILSYVNNKQQNPATEIHPFIVIPQSDLERRIGKVTKASFWKLYLFCIIVWCFVWQWTHIQEQIEPHFPIINRSKYNEGYVNGMSIFQ